MAFQAATVHEIYGFCRFSVLSFPDGSRLLFRLMQAQLFEAVSGPCPIAYEYTR